MKVTGIQLQHAIRMLGNSLTVVSKLWNESLFAFDDDQKAPPVELMASFRECEDKIARLQTAQSRYNLSVMVDVLGTKMTLAEAIKRVGGAGRAEKMWRSAAADTGNDRYHSREMTRTKGEERAQRMVSVSDTLRYISEAGKYASALRGAIQVANGTEIEIEDLSPALFE